MGHNSEGSNEAPIYILTDQHESDILTKPLEKGKFEALKGRLGLVHNSFLARRECWNITRTETFAQV
jgi:hypothetical protein